MNLNPKQRCSSEEKNWQCPFYEKCLDIASARHWENWGCTDCNHKEKIKRIECNLSIQDDLPYKIDQKILREIL